MIANYFTERPDIPSYHNPDHLFHSIGGWKEDGQINDPTGWLIVWNADTWKCQLAKDTINYHDYNDHWENKNLNYICPDLFDYITLSIDPGNGFDISSIKIVLNDITIYEKLYPAFDRLCIRFYHPIALDNKIAEYKHLSLVCHRSPNDPSIGYDSNAILSNNLLSMAAKELGQSWSPKYAPEARWRKLFHNKNWATAPDNWCADFAGWLYEKKHNVQNFKSVPYTINGIVNYFKRRDFFCSASTIPYENLGHIIHPGYFATIRQGGHMVIFLYWIDAGVWHGYNQNALNPGPNDDTFYHLRNARQIARYINNGIKDLNSDYSNQIVGPFRPDAPVNWFCAINGNSGGGRVKLSIIPVINLFQRNEDNMSPDALWYLFEPRSDGINGVLYSEVGDWRTDEEFHYPIVAWEDGFALTHRYVEQIEEREIVP